MLGELDFREALDGWGVGKPWEQVGKPWENHGEKDGNSLRSYMGRCRIYFLGFSFFDGTF
jgi:hypothetical protein